MLIQQIFQLGFLFVDKLPQSLNVGVFNFIRFFMAVLAATKVVVFCLFTIVNRWLSLATSL
jgi:hypothetical protein